MLFLIFLYQIFFSGDTDAVIPVTSTRYSIDALKLPTVTPWHAWYDDDGEVGPFSPQPIRIGSSGWNLYMFKFVVC